MTRFLCIKILNIAYLYIKNPSNKYFLQNNAQKKENVI